MKTRLILFVSLALVSFGQSPQAPSGGSFIAPKFTLSLPRPGDAATVQQQPPSGGSFIAPKLTLPLPVLTLPHPTASTAESSGPEKCAVPLVAMKLPSSTDAITIQPRPTLDPIEIRPPAPACW